jgi:hypothetical protein
MSKEARKPTYQHVRARELILKALSGGEVLALEIFDKANENRIGRSTLLKAKKELNVISVKSKFGGGWAWCFSDNVPEIDTHMEKRAETNNRNKGERAERLLNTAYKIEEQINVLESMLTHKKFNALIQLLDIEIKIDDDFLNVLKNCPKVIVECADIIDKNEKLSIYQNWVSETKRFLRLTGDI